VTKEILVQGRRVGSEDLVWLRRWMELHSQWSRKRLARELCPQWQWVDGRGRLKDLAARSFLLKLEAQGQVRLPPLQTHQLRAPPGRAPMGGLAGTGRLERAPGCGASGAR